MRKGPRKEIKSTKKSRKVGIHVRDISSAVDERQKKKLSQRARKAERLSTKDFDSKLRLKK